MTGNRAFDFTRINVFATADDHVLEAVDDVDIAVVVHVGAVTGVHPAATQRLGGFFGFVPVAEHDVRATDQHFTDRAARHLVVVFVDDAHGHAQPWPPGRAQATIGNAFGAVVLRTVGANRRRRFGHAVALGELDVGQRLERQLQQGHGNR
ncbi:hypothetical protein D3C87_1606260 [compost metagenome]